MHHPRRAAGTKDYTTERGATDGHSVGLERSRPILAIAVCDGDKDKGNTARNNISSHGEVRYPRES